MKHYSQFNLEIIGKVYYGYDRPATKEEADLWLIEIVEKELLSLREQFHKMNCEKAEALLAKK